MEAQAMGRNISNEFLAVLDEWAPQDYIVCEHVVTDAGGNMLVVLNVTGFEGIVCHRLACPPSDDTDPQTLPEDHRCSLQS